MMQEESERLYRGAQAIADYYNSRLNGGPPLTRAAIYRMVEQGKIPVCRFGQKRSEFWATESNLDKALNGEAA